MPRTAPLAEESRIVDGRKVTRITRLDEATSAPYDGWVTEPAEVAGQGRVWRDSGWSQTSTPSERYRAATEHVRVRGPEPTDAEKVAEHIAEIRLSNPGLADQIEAIAAKKLPVTPAGQLFDPGKISVSLNAIAGPPSASYLAPDDLAAYLGRHATGDLGGFGVVPDELSDDQAFCPPRHGHAVEAKAAIDSGHGLVVSAFPVWAPDRPLTRKGDSIYVLTLLVPGRQAETTVASDRDGISF